MGSWAELNQPSFRLGAPFSTDSIFKTCDLNLDMRFVLILDYKHVRTAGLTVQCQSTVNTYSVWLGGGEGSWVVLETILSRSLTRPHSKKFTEPMLSNWILHRRHIHWGNTCLFLPPTTCFTITASNNMFYHHSQWDKRHTICVVNMMPQDTKIVFLHRSYLGSNPQPSEQVSDALPMCHICLVHLFEIEYNNII